MKNFLILFSIVFLAISCQPTNKPNTDEVAVPAVNYKLLGDSLSKQAQMSLMSNVTSAMQKGGPTYAVDFCHENAESISETLAKKSGTIIQRISLLNRNPKNAPADKQDSLILNYFADTKSSGMMVRDTIVYVNKQAVYYKPIAIQLATCLKCHGNEGNDIDDKTLAILNLRYPKDKAVNYKMGDLRGAWKITFGIE